MNAAEPTTDVWLIRHGQPSDEMAGRCYGSSDIELSQAGAEQIRKAGQIVPANSLSAIYSSPRSRCIESAKILAATQSCSVSIRRGLAEIDFGAFEGSTYDAIRSAHPDLYQAWMEQPTQVHFPGESLDQMQSRVLECADELRLRHQGSSYAIVAHGGVNRILLANALGIANANIFRMAQRYGAVNLLRYYGAYATVELINAG